MYTFTTWNKDKSTGETYSTAHSTLLHCYYKALPVLFTNFRPDLTQQISDWWKFGRVITIESLGFYLSAVATILSSQALCTPSHDRITAMVDVFWQYFVTSWYQSWVPAIAGTERMLIQNQGSRHATSCLVFVEVGNRSRIHERPISLRSLGIILRFLRLEDSVWISWNGVRFPIRFSPFLLYSVQERTCRN
jgi:hypothetical protein